MGVVTASGRRVFRSARVKLTLAYTVGIAVVMAIFSVSLYVILAGSMASNLDVNGSSQLEQTVLNAELARARLALLGINLGAWIVAAAISYLIAGRTLRPIEAALARQRQFTAHASHELRTPLTVIKGEIDVTLARPRSPEEYCYRLSLIDAEVDHLNATVGDLLAMARLETGQGVTDRQHRNVHPEIQEVVDLFRARLADGAVELTMEVPEALAANLDWARFRHVLINLVDNAIRHTPPHGEIRVTARQHGRDLHLQVFNSDSHLAENDLPHLFVPFYRGRHAQADSGTGLGLALCDWIVRAHGGSISARNEPSGVSFVVHVPRL